MDVDFTRSHIGLPGRLRLCLGYLINTIPTRDARMYRIGEKKVHRGEIRMNVQHRRALLLRALSVSVRRSDRMLTIQAISCVST